MSQGSAIQRPKFSGKTIAYGQFSLLLWRTRSLIDLGTVGIDQELEDKIAPLLAKFSGAKGVRGRLPKNYQPNVTSAEGPDDELRMELDARSAHLLKRVLESHKKRHEDLRCFHYANLAVALWASFETYNVTLFEELYRERPELLKSSEQIQVKEAVEHHRSMLDFLIERQLEAIGHLKLKETLEYYKKRLGIEISMARAAKLEKYYFLRNVVAHKTGLVRPTQKLKAQEDFHIVGDEIRVSRTFLIRMASSIEATVRSIEMEVVKKFFSSHKKKSRARSRRAA